MARINIEDKLFLDERYNNYLFKKGSKPLAIGLLYIAWRRAQDFYFINGGRIPKKIWVNEKLDNDLIECQFAVDEGDFIYVKGSKRNFEWLSSKSKNGKMGGRPKKSLSVDFTKENEKLIKANESERNPLTLTLPLTLKTNTKKEVDVEFENIKNQWNEFCKSYLNGKKQINILTKSRINKLKQYFILWEDNEITFNIILEACKQQEWLLKECNTFGFDFIFQKGKNDQIENYIKILEYKYGKKDEVIIDVDLENKRQIARKMIEEQNKLLNLNKEE